jgi:voltage-gated potassium channel
MSTAYTNGELTPMAKFRIALSVLVLVLVGGTTGFVFIEDMSIVEGMYMTVITLSTVGFGEVRPLHPAGRLFVIVLIVFGVMIAGYIAKIIGEMLLEGQFREIVARRKMDKKLKNIKGHFIVAGFGRVGMRVAREFQARGVEYVVIEKSPENRAKLLSDQHVFLEGDATEEDVLREAGIERAETLISTLPEEAQNVYLTLTARSMNPSLKIIARADFEEGEKKLMRAGADVVVIPHVLGGMRMAMASLQPNVVDFMQMATLGGEGLAIEEVVIQESAPICGRTILESKFKADYGATIIGIKKHGSRMEIGPGPGTVLEKGDILVLVGDPDRLTQLTRRLE